MTQAEMIAEMLGGIQVLEVEIHRDQDLEQAVRTGIPSASVRALAAATSTTLTLLQDLADIDRGTFARRSKNKMRLKPSESDRIARIARIAARAIETLGREHGLAWLRERNRALGGRIPVELLQTDIGAAQVEQILGRIEYGVFS
jgi:putative toxin-antitoxin system antitoxin component (TIGR02293 family)